MKRSKNIALRIVAAALGLLILAGILFFSNSLVGNPASAFLANRGAKAYLAKQYPGNDFETEKASYNFKFSRYIVRVQSKSSGDTHFSLSFDGAGKLKNDDYPSYVESRFNTWSRLDSEYGQLVDTVLKSESFPYESDIRGGSIRDVREIQFGVSYGIRQAELVLDKAYDMSELGKTAGSIVLYVQHETVSFERAAEILQDVATRLTAGGVNFYAIDFVLEQPRPEGEAWVPGGAIRTQNFLYSDIAGEGLAGRIEQHHAALAAYYEEADKERDAQVNGEKG